MARSILLSLSSALLKRGLSSLAKFAGGFFGGGSSSFGSATNFGGSPGGLPDFAHAGIISSPTLANVDVKRGPELIAPLRDLPRLMGSAVGRQEAPVINNHTVIVRDRAEAEQEANSLRQMRNTTVQIIDEELRRGEGSRLVRTLRTVS